MISAALVVAGSSTLIVNTFALRNVEYPSVYSFNSALLDELSISQSTVVQHIRQHPEELFGSQFAEQPLPDGRTVGEVARTLQQRPIDEALANARRWSFVGLVAVLVGAVGAAWVLAGSILRPIRRMTARARSASVSDLGARVSAGGPNDEIRELADTFDAMLDRLASAFDAQRRFASQVAHELRTPLATTRTEIAMLLDDTTDRDTACRLEAARDAVDRGERLVARLLVLSRVDLRALEKSRFAFDELVGNVLGRVVEGPAFSRLRVDVDLRTTEVTCDRALVESLVRNLLDNSARHNRAADGWVRVEVAPDPESGMARLVVANSVAAPTESFSRLPGQDVGPAPSSPGGPGGADSDVPSRPGTGLSIVNAVLRAHGGAIAWTRCPDGVAAHITIPAVRVTEQPGVPTVS
ncbi:histidine kinase dimerization/phospho-acceptor domain-containing protein [Parafrankia sp. FMc2]|uniref:histidine kinase dimerization/phospho-acceptor domain-containing protein n=1 Tax=Parafrankia sp. FMc2 TaxID=3233196 RepID=UPI0034D4E31C